MEKNQNLIEDDAVITENTPQLPPETEQPESNRGIVIGAILGLIVFLSVIILCVYLLLQDGETTEIIRDIFIIFMSVEFLVIGLALIIMIVQLASLINLLQNEVAPILESTNETANTLRGTTKFLAENFTEPVIKLNSYLAGLRKLLNIKE